MLRRTASRVCIVVALGCALAVASSGVASADDDPPVNPDNSFSVVDANDGVVTTSAPEVQQEGSVTSGAAPTCDSDAACTMAQSEQDSAPPTEARKLNSGEATNGTTSSSTVPSDWADIPDWCIEQAESGVETYGVQRTQACAVNTYQVVVTKIRNGLPVAVGGQTGLIVNFVYTTTAGRAWRHQIEVSPSTAWGSGIGAAITLTPTCTESDACTPVSDRSPIQRPLVGDAAYAEATWKWNRADRNATGFGVGNWEASWKGAGATPSNPLTYTAPAVRCDSVVAGVGCVFPTAVPSLGYQDWYWPGFAAHLKSAFASGLPGEIGSGQDLHRTQDKVRVAANRRIACPASFPRPADQSCDEYPFASTYEGASAGLGPGRTFSPAADGWDCGISALPTGVIGPGYSACMIPDSVNSAAGSVLNAQMYQRWRVIDGDAFTVGVLTLT
jgi:hypothetical protein